MGCCMGDMAAARIEQRNKIMQEQFAQNMPEPYINATGQIVVQVSMFSGDWPSTYPVWIKDWGVNEQEWSTVITTLTNATKPLVQAMFDGQKEAARTMGNAFVPTQKTQTAAMGQAIGGMATYQQMPAAIASALYQLNQSLFEPKGLQANGLGGVGMTVYKKDNPPQNQFAAPQNMAAMNPQQQAMLAQMQNNPQLMQQQQQMAAGMYAHPNQGPPPQYTHQ
mmetsp:Transcript_33738/g.53988  ORF Transcript_33738/g.53988 Transcript_33738/m.53988 type:complete len:222 (-) Transcript_33738:253-918(-)|eukprot:CAMPEP_0197033256 /NCGR_PEP_ID=MMETSP1384-20130603/11721_1 /TAXON_ID=29189 /ORGANISM="Ammonia sp." /LENGTH=221 /DNA_ID=CAMNT_0042463045 /DNA_START=35 /DNA_END=700 /DNA_ORIENTATION=+